MITEITSHLHPIFVHFPIALIVVGACYDLWRIFFRRSLPPEKGLWIWVAAMAGALLAVWSGPEHDARGVTNLIEVHSTLADTAAWVTVFIVVARVLLWRAKKPLQGFLLSGYLIFSVLSAVLVLAAGYYGGEMVYDQGIGVSVNGKQVNPPVRSFHRSQENQ